MSLEFRLASSLPFKCPVPGPGFQVSGTGHLVPGSWYPAPEPVRRRGPDTGYRGPTRKCAPRVCV